MSPERRKILSRREFLRISTLAGLGVILTVASGDGPVQAQPEVEESNPEVPVRLPVAIKEPAVKEESVAEKEQLKEPSHCYVVTGMDQETCSGGSTVAIYPTEEVIVFKDGTEIGPFERDKCGTCVPAGDKGTG